MLAILQKVIILLKSSVYNIYIYIPFINHVISCLKLPVPFNSAHGELLIFIRPITVSSFMHILHPKTFHMLHISGDTAVCSQHSWCHTSDSTLITVCTICNNCSKNGSSCDHNGIMGTNYRECGCRTQQTCCRNCGICRRCAEGFWVISLITYFR